MRERIRIVTDYDCIKIYYTDLLFVYIKRDEFVGIQSWIEGGNKWCIEFTTKTNTILTELMNQEVWMEMLTKIDQLLNL